MCEMKKPKLTPSGTALSDTIFELLRLNSRILTAGDRLVSSLGLTSARWQVALAAHLDGVVAHYEQAQLAQH